MSLLALVPLQDEPVAARALFRRKREVDPMVHLHEGEELEEPFLGRQPSPPLDLSRVPHAGIVVVQTNAAFPARPRMSSMVDAARLVAIASLGPPRPPAALRDASTAS
jgi:hypothetical protein